MGVQLIRKLIKGGGSRSRSDSSRKSRSGSGSSAESGLLGSSPANFGNLGEAAGFNADDDNEGTASNAVFATVSSEESGGSGSGSSLFSFNENSVPSVPSIERDSDSPSEEPERVSGPCSEHTSENSDESELLQKQIWSEHSNEVIDNRRYTASIDLIDSAIYLNNCHEGRPVVIRGSISLDVHRPTRLRAVRLHMIGEIHVNYFYRSDMLIKSQKHDVHRFISKERSWAFNSDGAGAGAGAGAVSTDERIFEPGQYKFPFHFVIPDGDKLPESMVNPFGSVFYKLELEVSEPPKAYSPKKTNITKGEMYPQFIQCFADAPRRHRNSANRGQMISTANWRNILFYKVRVWFEPPLSVGSEFHVEIKLLPIERERYKIRAIRVYLIQKFEYNVKNTSSRYYSDLTQTEKIPLMSVNIRDMQNTQTCRPYLKTLSLKLMPVYVRSDEGWNKFVLVPSTNKVENKLCPFKVSHRIAVGIVLQESNLENTSYLDQVTDKTSRFMQKLSGSECGNGRGCNEIEVFSDDEIPLKRSPIEITREAEDNDFIVSTARMVQEMDTSNQSNRYMPVELMVNNPIQLLKEESKYGNIPPPSYDDSAVRSEFLPNAGRAHWMAPAYEELEMLPHYTAVQ